MLASGVPSPLPMHIPDGFLSVAVAVICWALTAVGVSLWRSGKALGPRQVPLMGVLAALIFAAQMLNFTVAGGTSGHLIGGVLAAIPLGSWAAILMMTTVVGIQALEFKEAVEPAVETPPAQKEPDVVEPEPAAMEQARPGLQPVSPMPSVEQASPAAAPTTPRVPGWVCGAVGGAGVVLAVLVCLGVTLGPRLFDASTVPTGAPTARPTGAPTGAPTARPTGAPTGAPTARPTGAPTRMPTSTNTPTPRPTATPDLPSLGDAWTRPADGMVMVYVPAGEFEMGSTVEDVDYMLQMCAEWGYDCEWRWFEDEHSVHTVALDAYWIDETEVTNAQYAAFLNVQGNQTEGGVTWLDIKDEDCLIEQSGGEYRPQDGYDDHPVIEVSWYGAAAYCEWIGGRLPTEAEWEYAARGLEGRVFPWGDDFECARGNFDDETTIDDYVVPGGEGCDGYDRTAPVGSFSSGKSWCGALDMAGNVWEWAADWYGEYPSGRQANPTGPSSGEYRVVRGGSWDNNPFRVRAADRNGYTPDGSINYYGFRCARGSE